MNDFTEPQAVSRRAMIIWSIAIAAVSATRTAGITRASERFSLGSSSSKSLLTLVLMPGNHLPVNPVINELKRKLPATTEQDTDIKLAVTRDDVRTFKLALSLTHVDSDVASVQGREWAHSALARGVDAMIRGA
jgi:hypothetical protein